MFIPVWLFLLIFFPITIIGLLSCIGWSIEQCKRQYEADAHEEEVEKLEQERDYYVKKTLHYQLLLGLKETEDIGKDEE